MSVWVVILLIVLILLLAAPFLVPVVPLKGTVPETALADAQSKFIQVNGLMLHYKEIGQGQQNFILLHGFGASLFSWNRVMPPLSALGRVIAFDRPAFGLTSRPLTWQGQSPYGPEAQVRLLIALMDVLGVQKAWLVGNSAGGSIATAAALAHPGRVAGLILVDAAIYAGGGTPAGLLWLFNLPQINRLGPLLARQLAVRGDDFVRTGYHNPALVTDEVLAGYHKPLSAHHWDRALWEFTKASQPPTVSTRLAGLKMPVLVITGDDDRIVPTAQSLQLAKEIPGAQLAVIRDAGHLPHEEKPSEFVQAVQGFLAALPTL